jgi:hypothetical protein
MRKTNNGSPKLNIHQGQYNKVSPKLNKYLPKLNRNLLKLFLVLRKVYLYLRKLYKYLQKFHFDLPKVDLYLRMILNGTPKWNKYNNVMPKANREVMKA